MKALLILAFILAIRHEHMSRKAQASVDALLDRASA